MLFHTDHSLSLETQYILSLGLKWLTLGVSYYALSLGYRCIKPALVAGWGGGQACSRRSRLVEAVVIGHCLPKSSDAE
jgi:hypothetical protein